jgi:hypothetical protein
MERHELPALVTQQMMMVLAGWIRELIAGDPVAEIQAVDEFVFVQQLQGAIDTGPADGALAAFAAPERVLDLESAESAVLVRE